MTNTEPTIEELRRWSAKELMGFAIGEDSYSYLKNPWDSIHSYINIEDWLPDDPTTGQIWMVVEKMKEVGAVFELSEVNMIDHGIMFASVFAWDWRALVEGTRVANANPCLAILKAAYQAWRYKP